MAGAGGAAPSGRPRITRNRLASNNRLRAIPVGTARKASSRTIFQGATPSLFVHLKCAWWGGGVRASCTAVAFCSTDNKEKIRAPGVRLAPHKLEERKGSSRALTL